MVAQVLVLVAVGLDFAGFGQRGLKATYVADVEERFHDGMRVLKGCC